MNTPSSLIVHPIGTPRTNPHNISGIYRPSLVPIELSNIKMPEYVVVNGIRSNLTSYNDIMNLVISGQITHHIVDPSLQAWAGATKNLLKGNRIVTLFDKNGMIYYVKAQYNPISRSILPAL